MKYINEQMIQRLDAASFQATKPYPWVNPELFLTDAGFERLVETLPPADQFEKIFGKARGKGGQQPHDRLSLEYRPGLSLSAPWREFIGEIEGPIYRRFLERMFGRKDLRLLMHWHYTPTGCSVSPHCDSRSKLGSHIFYFNTDKDWRPEWGGQTLILDDNDRFPDDSAPNFEDFDNIITSHAMGNSSLLFMRADRSWHGVREICSPPNALRKVFIVVIEDATFKKRAAPKSVGGFRERIKRVFLSDAKHP